MTEYIHNSASLKRINREIKNFNDQNYKLGTMFNNNINFINITKFFDNIKLIVYIVNDEIALEVHDKDKLMFDIDIPNTYPFKPYKITDHHIAEKQDHLYNIGYTKFLANINKYIDHNIKHNNYDIKIIMFFYKIYTGNAPRLIKDTKDNCICCNSILCGNNWSPACNIVTFLLEYMEVQFLYKYTKKANYMFMKKTYDSLYKIGDNNLPCDIIEKIFGYI